MRRWMLSGTVIVLLGTLLGTLLGVISGCAHNPNHGIDMEKARAAARRVHTPPKLSPSDRDKIVQDHGG